MEVFPVTSQTMRLHYAPTSPYVRKVMVAAHELGVADRLTLLTTTPGTVVPDVAPDNPLAQIPTLMLGDGTTLYDSLVIIEYLDVLHGGGLVPRDGPARWTALRRHALGHGLIDAAVGLLHEGRRPAEYRYPAAEEKLQAATLRVLDALENEQPRVAPGFTVGDIAIACGLGYVDYRFPETDWRAGRALLAKWYAGIAERPSMAATQPPS